MHSAARRLWPEDCDGARELVARLSSGFKPLIDLYADPTQRPLSEFARAHAEAAEALAALPEDETSAVAAGSPLWQGE
jgi:ATP-dependent helicase/nuclease subunit B